MALEAPSKKVDSELELSVLCVAAFEQLSSNKSMEDRMIEKLSLFLVLTSWLSDP